MTSTQRPVRDAGWHVSVIFAAAASQLAELAGVLRIVYDEHALQVWCEDSDFEVRSVDQRRLDRAHHGVLQWRVAVRGSGPGLETWWSEWRTRCPSDRLARTLVDEFISVRARISRVRDDQGA